MNYSLNLLHSIAAEDAMPAPTAPSAVYVIHMKKR